MLHLELGGTGPRYERLARSLRSAIQEGRLKPGTRLPASRELAHQLGVSRNTVVTAYEMLCVEGLAHGRGGSGTFVSGEAATSAARHEPDHVEAASRYAARLRELPPFALRRLPPRLRYDLQYGEPLTNLPLTGAWSRALAHAAERAELHYPHAQGVLALREAIADHVGRRRGIACDSNDVVVVHGTQQAISLLARVLADEGDEVVLEEPHYELVTYALQAHGLAPIFVDTDREGLVCEELPPRPVRFVYVTPSHQFPTGAELSLRRRRALLAYAEEHGAWIVEDDYDGEFRYEPGAMPALKSLDERGRVFYVGTFSKVLFPALRLGFVIAPRAMRRDLVMAKRLDDLGCSAIEQCTMATFMRDGSFDRHLRKAWTELRRRRSALLAGLARHAPALEVVQSAAGMHVVAWLPGWTTARFDALIATAAERGLGLHPIHPHYVRPPHWPGLLLGFAGLSVSQLRAATALLGQCLAAVPTFD
jgi:GntR family transcriptional regulator/MocR family aminotransferase